MLDSQNILLGSHNYPIRWQSISFKNEKCFGKFIWFTGQLGIGEEYMEEGKSISSCRTCSFH